MMPETKKATVPYAYWQRVGTWMVRVTGVHTGGVDLEWKQASRRTQIRAKRREAGKTKGGG